MIKDEIQHKAYEFLRTITPYKWYDLREGKDVSEDIIAEVLNIIDKGKLDGKYHFGLNTQFSYLFMKTLINKK